MCRYFPGNRNTGRFEYTYDGVAVIHRIDESWENIGFCMTLRCNSSYSDSESIEVGVESKVIEQFKTYIEGTIGIKDVASLKSHIEAQSSNSTTFSIKKVHTRAFNLPPPGCGSETSILYQLVKCHHFTFEKHRVIRKNLVTNFSITERTCAYEVLIDRDPLDPACPCKLDSEEVELGDCSIQLGNLGIRTAMFVKQGVGVVKRLFAKIGGYEADLVSGSLPGFVSVDSTHIDQGLFGLTGLEAGIHRAEVHLNNLSEEIVMQPDISSKDKTVKFVLGQQTFDKLTDAPSEEFYLRNE